MKKFRFFIDFNKEEKYLNEMAKQGYLLKKYTSWGRYHFTKSTPQDLTYRIDCRKFKTKKDFDSYISLFNDAGWKHISGTRYSDLQFFLSINEESGNDIFSDKESSASRYKNAYTKFLSYLMISIMYFIIFINNGLYPFKFLTPGLWERTGLDFIRAFLFELPFVLIRSFFPLVIIVGIIFYAILCCKTKKYYNNILNK